MPSFLAYNKPAMAVANNGAAVSLVTMAAAKQLKLHICMNLKPDLFPIWSDKTYQSIGQATICLQVEGGPKFWDDAVVVNMKVPWELLVSNHAQEGLGIHLMTPAMCRCLKGTECTPDHPDKLPDGPYAVHDSDYDTMPDPTVAQDPQMFPLMDGPPGVPPIKEPVVSCPMWVRLGLPTGYFVEVCDVDFLKWDALYPVVMTENVASRTMDQCTTDKLHKSLLKTLMTAGALHEYLSGCLLPAAYV
ncbi:hypothetical protein LPJ66_003279 [Kickxella alabastrina]|uniref:Uncharacterized protein n=1 Tax=Kickxella alabastrina TaxID=61397 RepID=A0ACC1IMH6_9FUNG|nr:hypothetical protein LPJ66_003279 [Kickxella alabastrina]